MKHWRRWRSGRTIDVSLSPTEPSRKYSGKHPPPPRPPPFNPSEPIRTPPNIFTDGAIYVEGCSVKAMKLSSLSLFGLWDGTYKRTHAGSTHPTTTERSTTEPCRSSANKTWVVMLVVYLRFKMINKPVCNAHLLFLRPCTIRHSCYKEGGTYKDVHIEL